MRTALKRGWALELSVVLLRGGGVGGRDSPWSNTAWKAGGSATVYIRRQIEVAGHGHGHQDLGQGDSQQRVSL